jgi:PIN domain nuclease of toxin-antitoxin system
MTTDCVTDTHGLIWYLEDSPLLGAQAQRAFDACDREECRIYVPTICLVEIIYLQEKGRIPSHLLTQFQTELYAGDNGLLLADLTLAVTAALASIARTEIPDMPDRIVAATALHLGLPLISRDQRIGSLQSIQSGRSLPLVSCAITVPC